MYKVKNKAKQLMKYRDKHTGRDVFVEPNKTIETNYPPIASAVWSVINTEEIEKEINIEEIEKTKLNTKEDKNGSSSSRRRMDGNLSDSNISTSRK